MASPGLRPGRGLAATVVSVSAVAMMYYVQMRLGGESPTTQDSLVNTCTSRTQPPPLPVSFLRELSSLFTREGGHLPGSPQGACRYVTTFGGTLRAASVPPTSAQHGRGWWCVCHGFCQLLEGSLPLVAISVTIVCHRASFAPGTVG